MTASFSRSSTPLPADEIIIGDTGLLPQFLNLCSLFQTGTLFFTAPFFDDAFLKQLAGRLSPRQTELEIIAKSDDCALALRERLTVLGWREPHVAVVSNLHAKVYIFESSSRQVAALIGSHNATAAACGSNVEVGVLLRSKLGTPQHRTLDDLKNYFRGKSSLPYGTLRSTTTPRS